MRYGLLCTADVDTAEAIHGYVELNVEAEALGLCSTFLVEHHFSGWNQVAATLMLQTLVAARTSTLRLGTGVMVLPWHNPVLLAEQAATLDVISGGRLDLGVGKGYRHSEFRGFNVDRGEADARFEEALAVLLRSWTTRGRFSHHGTYWDFDDIVVEPPPVQSPHPPIWVAAASETSVRRAAARGHHLVLDQYASVDQIAERIAWFRAGPPEAGHTPSGDGAGDRAEAGAADNDGDRADDADRADAGGGDRDGTGAGRPQVTVARQVYVAHSRAEAEEALARTAEFTRRTVDVSRAPGTEGGSHVLAYADTEAHALFGTPDEVCKGLGAVVEAGADQVLVNLAGGARQLRRFAAEVMPDVPD